MLAVSLRMTVLIALFAPLTPALAQDTPPAPPASDAPAAPATHPGDALHARFDRLLGAYVSDGWVDYAGLAKEGRDELRAYLAELAASDPAQLDRAATLAFWINAYNAFTLELILDHHGAIESIKDIPSRERWDAKRWEVHGRAYSLDQIEHEILRPLGDARVHFALVCASKSCPDLGARALLPSRVDEQLEAAGRAFLADTFKGLKTATEEGWFGDDHNIYVSRIFSWFDEDFERDEGSLVDYLLRFAPDEARTYIEQHRADLDVEFFDYDWTLNGR